MKCFLDSCLDGERWFEKMVGLLGGVIDLYLYMRMEKRVMMAKRGMMEASYDGSELQPKRNNDKARGDEVGAGRPPVRLAADDI